MRVKKSKKDSSANDKLDQLIAWHEERYSKWHHYREHGGSDPTWPDGSNMNLLRNHIISYKRQIKELCEANQIELPEEYHRLLPPEVCDDYMANTELIDENARKALGILESHPAYLELLTFSPQLTPKQKEKICFTAVVGYVSRLRSAIEKRDYVQMRCYSRHENYVDSFVSCLEKAKAMEPEQYQLSLFDIGA